MNSSSQSWSDLDSVSFERRQECIRRAFALHAQKAISVLAAEVVASQVLSPRDVMENVLSLLNVIGEFANFRYITGPPQATESAVQNTAPAGDTIADIPAVPNLVKAAIQGVIDSVPEAEFAARLDAITTAIKNRDSTSTPL